MKISLTSLSLRFVAAAVCMGAISLQAAGESLSAAEIAARAARAPQLSPAVEEVLKLSKGGVSDAVTLAYIQNSTMSYSMSAQNVLQLQEQGVSPQVIAAMLQRNGEVQRATEANHQAQAAAAAAKTPPAATTAPATTTVATAPSAPVSTVSVTYFGSRPVSYYPSYAYYGPGLGYYYPAYYAPRYYGYCGPQVAFGVGFGYPYRGYARCW
jgi:hypothetical protein